MYLVYARDAVVPGWGLIVQPADSLRYWEDASCYYAEQEKLIHFTKQGPLQSATSEIISYMDRCWQCT